MQNQKLEQLLKKKCNDYEIHSADIPAIVEQGFQVFYPLPDYPSPPQVRDPQHAGLTLDNFILKFKSQSTFSNDLSEGEKQSLALNDAASSGDMKTFRKLREQGQTLTGKNPSKPVTYQNTVDLG